MEKTITPIEDITLRGVFITQFINQAKKHLTEAQYQQLKQEFDGLQISGVNTYKATLQTNIERRCGELIYPDLSDTERAIKLGRISFQSFSQSTMGRTMMHVLSNSPEALVNNTAKLFDVLTKGIVIKVHKLTQNSMIIHIYNNPFDPHGLKGYFLEAMEFLGYQNAQIELQHVVDQEYIYTIHWSAK